MTTRGYGIFGNANNMFKQYRENSCIGEYITSKNKIKQQIHELQKRAPSYFCSKCSAIKTHIIAENNRINKCFHSSSKSLKLIEDYDIKGFIAECIEYPKCVHNRTPSVRKTLTPERAPVGNDKQQSLGDSKNSKPGGSPIKGPSGQYQNPTDGKALTKAKPIAHKPDGINSSRNSGEPQEQVSKQIANASDSNSGRRETQERTLSQSVRSTLSEADPRPSGSIKGPPNEEDHLLKFPQLMGLRISTSQSDSPSDQVPEDQIVKNQDPGDGASVTEITTTGDPAIKGVGKVPVVRSSVDRVACSNTSDGEETCDKKVVIRDSSPVTSYGVSTNLDTTLDEYPCSEDDFDELFESETFHNEAPDRETSSSTVIGKEALGTVLPTVMLNTSTEEGTKLAVLSQGHMASLSDIDSDLKTYQSTGPIISSSGCVASNRVEESAFSPLKEMCSEEQKNQDQLLSGQNSHQRDQLNQQECEQQEGQLYSEQGSSLQVEGRSGGATTLQAKEELDDTGKTNIIHLIEKYKKYIISGLLPLVIFLLLALLIKCTPLGTLFTKKKGRKRKEMNEKIQRVLSEPSSTREGRIPFSYSAFEYSTY